MGLGKSGVTEADAEGPVPVAVPELAGKLPVSVGKKLPVSVGGKLPVSVGGKLPVSVGGKLPVSVGGKLPVSVGRKLPVSVAEKGKERVGKGMSEPVGTVNEAEAEGSDRVGTSVPLSEAVGTVNPEVSGTENVPVETPEVVASGKGAATRTTLEITVWTGSSPQVSTIWSRASSARSATGLVTMLVVAPPLSTRVELYTVVPSRTTDRLQSVASALLRRDGDDDDMTVTSKETATPSEGSVSGTAALLTVKAEAPLAGGVMRTAGSPSKVITSALVVCASDRSTEAVDAAPVVVPVVADPVVDDGLAVGSLGEPVTSLG
jgi:hypothetical protein